MLSRLSRLLFIAIAVAGSARAQTNVDPAHKFAWGENTGWTNWHDAGDPDGAQGVHVANTFLSGFVWAENVGWINLGDGTPANGIEYANVNGTDFGVNRDPDNDELYGLGWGENVGWLNFAGGALATPPNPARVDFSNCTLAGFVWGENIGWINLDDATAYVGLQAGLCGSLVGDLNCDSTVDFGDINPFVLYLSNFAAWQTTYAGCNPANGDINGDGSYPSFGDINPFVALLSGGG
jgi:hypothetical protein